APDLRIQHPQMGVIAGSWGLAAGADPLQALLEHGDLFLVAALTLEIGIHLRLVALPAIQRAWLAGTADQRQQQQAGAERSRQSAHGIRSAQGRQTPRSMASTRPCTASRMARSRTLPLRVEPSLAVPPKPMISRLDSSYSPAPWLEYTTSEVAIFTTLRLTLA